MMKNYNEILTFVGKKLITSKSKRSVVVIDSDMRVGFDENDHEVVIYAQFYTNHDGRAILDYLKNKVEEVEEIEEVMAETVEELDYSEMTKKELIAEIEKREIDVKDLSRKKNAELVEILNAH